MSQQPHPHIILIQSLKGVGPARSEALISIGITTVQDLLYFIPRRYIDRSTILTIQQLQVDMIATVIGRVTSVGVRPGRRSFLTLSLQDTTGNLTCTWFRGVHFLRHVFSKGDLVMVSGKVAQYRTLQMTHPDYEILDHESDGEESLNAGRIIPIYPSNASLVKVRLGGKVMRRLVNTALETHLTHVQEHLPQVLLKKRALCSLQEALTEVHFPTHAQKLPAAQRRLAYDELFTMELMLALRRARIKQARTKEQHPAPSHYALIEPFIANLPYTLTNAQKRVLMEILNDMDAPSAMNRLLQGDVGSGKTVIALSALLRAVERGQQAVLMVPTEVLAEQHFNSMHTFFQQLGITTVLVTGSTQKDAKQTLATGEAHIGVGTHALFQRTVTFHNLGLVVIDEQHKFGVMQRTALYKKGATPDVLVMTATPIPRTLSMTVYGDLDASILDEMPPGRGTITTQVQQARNRPKFYGQILDELHKGHQAYIIFPLVEESEKLDLSAAVQSHATLSTGIFTGYTCGLLHGKMKSAEKESILSQFRQGTIQVLIATTVIEVGVDVPNATVMLIEHAERFGLAQLHQLRGRIGRGGNNSICILCATPPVTMDARKRLKALASTLDGFKIAEMDLEIRGPGECIGVRQHGIPEFHSANLLTDSQLLLEAREDAFALIADDPFLNAPEHIALKNRLKQQHATNQ